MIHCDVQYYSGPGVLGSLWLPLYLNLGTSLTFSMRAMARTPWLSGLVSNSLDPKSPSWLSLTVNGLTSHSIVMITGCSLLLFNVMNNYFCHLSVWKVLAMATQGKSYLKSLEAESVICIWLGKIWFHCFGVNGRLHVHRHPCFSQPIEHFNWSEMSFLGDKNRNLKRNCSLPFWTLNWILLARIAVFLQCWHQVLLLSIAQPSSASWVRKWPFSIVLCCPWCITRLDYVHQYSDAKYWPILAHKSLLDQMDF